MDKKVMENILKIAGKIQDKRKYVQNDSLYINGKSVIIPVRGHCAAAVYMPVENDNSFEQYYEIKIGEIKASIFNNDIKVDFDFDREERLTLNGRTIKATPLDNLNLEFSGENAATYINNEFQDAIAECAEYRSSEISKGAFYHFAVRKEYIATTDGKRLAIYKTPNSEVHFDSITAPRILADIPLQGNVVIERVKINEKERYDTFVVKDHSGIMVLFEDIPGHSFDYRDMMPDNCNVELSLPPEFLSQHKEPGKQEKRINFEVEGDLLRSSSIRANGAECFINMNVSKTVTLRTNFAFYLDAVLPAVKRDDHVIRLPYGTVKSQFMITYEKLQNLTVIMMPLKYDAEESGYEYQPRFDYYANVWKKKEMPEKKTGKQKIKQNIHNGQLKSGSATILEEKDNEIERLKKQIEALKFELNETRNIKNAPVPLRIEPSGVLHRSIMGAEYNEDIQAGLSGYPAGVWGTAKQWQKAGYLVIEEESPVVVGTNYNKVELYPESSVVKLQDELEKAA